MTVVQNVIERPGSSPVNQKVKIRLVSGATGGFHSGGREILSTRVVEAPVDTGLWSVDLIANSLITPANTYYEADEGSGVKLTFIVPPTGGPYWVNSLLVSLPTGPDATLGNVRYDVDQAGLTETQKQQSRRNIGASGAELAYAENRTRVTTALTIYPAASAEIPGTTIVVPVSSDPVDINYSAAFTQSVAGPGLIGLELWDITSAATQLGATGKPHPTLGAFSGVENTIRGSYRFDSVPTEKVLQLRGLIYRDSGSLAGSFTNGTLSSNQATWIQAVQR